MIITAKFTWVLEPQNEHILRVKTFVELAQDIVLGYCYGNVAIWLKVGYTKTKKHEKPQIPSCFCDILLYSI